MPDSLLKLRGRIPLAIKVLVIEPVVTTIVKDVDKEVAVSQPPTRRMLDGEDGGVFPYAGKTGS